MDRRLGRLSAVPRRFLVIVAISGATILIASMVFLWPTFSWLHLPKFGQAPHPGVYATYDVVSETATDAYLLVRPPGSLLSARLFRTQDAGATWHRIVLPASASGNGFELRRLSGGSLFLRTFAVAAQTQQFYITTGSTWAQITVPNQGSGLLQMVDADVGFYVVTDTGGTPAVQGFLIYRTLDGGRSWDQRLALQIDQPSSGGLRLSDDNRFVTFSDANHGWLVDVPPSWGVVCGTPSPTDPAQRLMASQDGGQSWMPVSLPNLPAASTTLSPPVFPASGLAGFLPMLVSTYSGQCPPVPIPYMYSTLDGGATWSGPERPPAPVFDSPDGIVWWAFDGRQLFRSINQGHSWIETKPKLPSSAATLQGLSAVSSKDAWSVWSGNDRQPSRQVLVRTTDGGAVWSEVKLPSD